MTEELEKPCCGNCRFWDPGDPGACRINSPVVHFMRLAENVTDVMTDDNFHAVGVWPSTRDRDWCGRHEWAPTADIDRWR